MCVRVNASNYDLSFKTFSSMPFTVDREIPESIKDFG